jgi:hypothetical protein
MFYFLKNRIKNNGEKGSHVEKICLLPKFLLILLKFNLVRIGLNIKLRYALLYSKKRLILKIFAKTINKKILISIQNTSVLTKLDEKKINNFVKNHFTNTKMKARN